MDFEEVLRDFEKQRAHAGSEEDALLCALMQKHHGNGRWKSILLAFSSLSETVRSKEWLQRRGRRLQELRAEPKRESKETKKAETTATQISESNEAPDVPFLMNFRMLKKAVMGCRTDQDAQGFLKNSKKVYRDIASLYDEKRDRPFRQGQIDSVLFDHYCAALEKSYPFKKSVQWTKLFCCRSRHCKTRVLLVKTLNAMGQAGDGEQIVISLRDSFIRILDAKAEIALEPPWTDVLPLCSDRCCPAANCMYTKPMAAVRLLVIEVLEKEQRQLSCLRNLRRAAGCVPEVLEANEVKLFLLGDVSAGGVAERSAQKIEGDLGQAYVGWLLGSILPTLGIGDADSFFGFKPSGAARIFR
eukprot:Skav233599  [mRNA]  locus=scaffold2520:759966:761039:- [translate_table: standard]